MSKIHKRASDKIHTVTQEILPAENAAEDLLSILSDGVIGIHKNGNISFINKTACSLTGWSQNEAKGQPLENVFQLSGKFSQPLDQKLIAGIINSGHLLGPITQQQINSTRNKQILVDFSISPLDENTVILMFHQLKNKKDQKTRTLLYQVSYDPLTHLANRDALQQTINHLHHDYQSTSNTYSILLLDLDRFKLINDSYGHKAGDQLLKLVAERMQVFIRGKDNVGRWGGEEFLCILPDTDLDTACEIAERLRHGISKKSFILDDREIFISASIGIANYPADGDAPEELFRIADATLYEAKRNGRNRIHSSNQMSGSIFSIGTQLEHALTDHRIIPVYQPIFNMQTGKQVAEEALARIKEDDGSLTEAGKFIDAAVQLQLVHRIDYEIIHATINRCSANYTGEESILPHFINISADMLRHPELVKEILEFAKLQCVSCGMVNTHLKPLVIEITEQELLHDINEVKRILSPFIEFGLPLAIDDFGSGYSSLSYLADLPVSYLKFDGSLIKRVAYEGKVRKIIEGIQRMASSLELTTIAEHIEDEATLNVLREIGVDWGQGHYLAMSSLTRGRK